ncbi:hypothetical protein BOTBODRAFT_301569 [Botryobasidium botryosum FD-172 SS1]|uniref:Uncharacterized protein n=1 Tax=Botryobasidium botryosum (strain FD-172 SS1) TaxID=930990 RepID=A0A067MK24_BOTB1|nr:hypothetical protein BOTBODRAFT_301569 [Botryobasidium botryosum FD-172 SS1]
MYLYRQRSFWAGSPIRPHTKKRTYVFLKSPELAYSQLRAHSPPAKFYRNTWRSRNLKSRSPSLLTADEVPAPISSYPSSHQATPFKFSTPSSPVFNAQALKSQFYLFRPPVSSPTPHKIQDSL